jgi:hypothetical protein
MSRIDKTKERKSNDYGRFRAGPTREGGEGNRHWELHLNLSRLFRKQAVISAWSPAPKTKNHGNDNDSYPEL